MPSQENRPGMVHDQIRHATNYGQVVVNVLSRMTHETGTIDQNLLRQCLGLASSYLITDTSLNAERGLSTWICGLNNLVDVLVALHVRGELELETMNEGSKACSECWMIAGTWKGLAESRVLVRGVASKLRTLLDGNGKTYRGERVYAPS
ncbi:hypothetical protein PILCRDRAFT_1071 [Piloderma croceum F 1598]|uniref:Uncharacterized protein n=1 Tax=Piloderma croceum (strain F 1598) TaxID=765440 RepID=A0A0C3BW95_PILCF|nr:hypothetical protein PILCRDRAFT_1071 [Piloderma croceum F 1598]